MEKITSKENSNIKQILRLKQKKYRDKEKLFFIEGKKMLLEALKSHNQLTKIFIDENKAEEYQYLQKLPWGTAKYLVDSKLMKAICDTDTPQGVAAIVKKPEWDLGKIENQESCMVLLDEIADPGNMGTILRTCWAFGINGVLLTKGCVDVFNPKVIRASMGGIFNLPVLVEITNSDLKKLTEKGYRFLGASPYAETAIYDIGLQGPVILVIGSEARGLSTAVEKLCEKFFKIPINAAVDSLNAATACAIITYELYKQRRNISSP